MRSTQVRRRKVRGHRVRSARLLVAAATAAEGMEQAHSTCSNARGYPVVEGSPRVCVTQANLASPQP
jgi:hypothetical protein